MASITVTQAAQLYGCHRSNIVFMIATGRLPAERTGNQYQIEESDVLRLIVMRDERERSNARIQGVHHAN